MKKFNLLYLLLLMFICSCSEWSNNSYTDGYGEIKGNIEDEDGNSVKNAKVFIKNDLSLYAESDETGKILLKNVPAGIHKIIGYSSDKNIGAVEEITVFANAPTELKMIFKPTGKINGKVLLLGQEDQVDTLVYLLGTSFVAYTDHEGNFSIFFVVPGCYTLRAKHEGFAPKEIENICIEMGEEKTIPEFMLTAKGSVECSSELECEKNMECKDGKCVYIQEFSKEICDGQDNDGNGYIDDGLASVCGSSIGECRTGYKLCLGAKPTDCIGDTKPVTEICNDEKDNDCDGEVDENCVEECTDIFACVNDSDCIKTDAECCPCPGGSIAINKNCEQEYKASLECPTPNNCLAVACVDLSIAVCDNGFCAKTLCGNGKCEEGETEENCVEDCGECIQEGESYEIFPDAPECCEGLTAIPASTKIEGECVVVPGGGYCTYCGDGKCNEPENECNCSEDCCEGMGESCTIENEFGKCEGITECEAGWATCPASTPAPEICDEKDNNCDGETDEGGVCGECIKEGGMFGYNENKQCCEGLKLLGPGGVSAENGECVLIDCDAWGICTECGNGECGIGENYCTCPEDCKNSCVEEGGVVMEPNGGIFLTDEPCCEGLEKVGLSSEPGCVLVTCINCGDGICDFGETKENCAEDCTWCTPNCSGKECGDDGCEGSCGTCSGGKICSQGKCISSSTGFNGKDNGDGTVTDLATGLMWQKKADDSEMDWEDAKTHCNNLSLAGYFDWKLPDIDELKTLLLNNEIDGCYIDPVFEGVCSWYWSSSSFASNTYYAWLVYFYNGYVLYYNKVNSGYVRCVRVG